MAIVALPSFEDPFYSMSVVLDGADYALEFRYNQREDAWYFDFGLPDGTILLRGIKVVCNLALIKRFADARLPPGLLFAVSGGSTNALPGRLELGAGKRVQLLYFDAAELAANEAAVKAATRAAIVARSL